MELKHIDIASLSVSSANMRGGKKAPDLTNILPSVRARGVLVPLIVREKDSDSYEIVAGKRRYHAALAIAEENGSIEPLPCAVMAAGDDAAALEASLIENIARLDPDEMTRHETFTRLVREGRNVEDISLTFGLTALQVKRTLALGNLMPRIRNLYRTDRIDAVTVRHLTLATKAQQREWLALLDSERDHAPLGQNLKAWLMGGAAISTKVALFGLEGYGGEIVSDLFGEDSYFACAADFWTAQMAAIEKRAEAFREAGWPEVVVMGRGEYFHTWEHERCQKKKGGRVYVAISQRGEVTFHEGYITGKEARKREAGETLSKPVRPEVSAPIQNYIDLHRHAAVRASLISQPAMALRLILAHVIVGSPLWRVDVEKQRANTDAIAESVEASASEAIFDAKRRAVLSLLDFDLETPTVTGGYTGDHGLPGLFNHLLGLSDEGVMSVLAIVMGETLAAGSGMVELLGVLLKVDMAAVWQADDALLDSIRDKEIMGKIVADVAGNTVATANAGESAKVQRQIVRDCVAGTNGRAKVDGWVPRWMSFLPSTYTERGGVGSVERWSEIASLLDTAETVDQPMAQAA
ncbi:ParB/RepB/Spo0J family partition protein [Sphingobium scionense]|uniref:ParB/RepB/Spo0J family partition protein n=2 Tax=Sphingobium TaxID=165695 RepID=A0AA42WXJ6_SPHYA|nr:MULTISPECIES: ParB/RepB/Spo0J family partition protein [Sphingobium]MBB4148071.1 ParB family chromosome partitioning protein [Sphingobium scionense]MDH2133628.1 ParB/RepB/Spo0J family partition protein [Sphingobium yanoikuyae]MDH2151552.1 ParB/RepB/Spo0J family partition protein [Sphingobium yanoikuyae]MDH2168943.1 ParB/RepB/Spo0J family partition protein [Sphingobium yanoikuyae]